MLIFGEPGLEKDNVAALIHFGSPEHDKPMVQVGKVDSSLVTPLPSCVASSSFMSPEHDKPMVQVSPP